MTEGVTEKTIGEFVAEDYRTASVFEKHGIDFCCGGMLTLASVCRERGLDCPSLVKELEGAKAAPIDRSQNYNSWELPFLADYIINTHHAYLKENVESIAAYTGKIAEVHGNRHPELIRINEMFAKIATDLMAHLEEEETVLFPAVRSIDSARKTRNETDPKETAVITASLERLNREHEEVGEAIHEIRKLANDFQVPEDACTTYALTYRKLKEFEDDLHKHVHLENNILFPKAVRT